jgi:hypothetical protein
VGVRWRTRWGNGVQSIFPNELRVLSPLLVSKKLVCECSHPAMGESQESKPENLANRGLIKSIMAGCIAVIQKRLLDGNAHSIPAWERARIQRCTCAKLSKQRNYGTEILWAHCLLAHMRTTCVCISTRMYFPVGVRIYVCVCSCERSALKSTPMSIGCR